MAVARAAPGTRKIGAGRQITTAVRKSGFQCEEGRQAEPRNGNIKPSSVVFIPGHMEDSHRDYVTQAWTVDPIADILNRLPEYHQ